MCHASVKKKVRSNPRYSRFFQTHYTAGDQEQFDIGRSTTNGPTDSSGNPTMPLPATNRYSDIDFSDNIQWDKYTDVGALAVSNTFSYMFNKFKKGIYVKIEGNKLHTFLPFSKKHFVNEWSDKIQFEPRYGSMMGMAMAINRMLGKKWRPNINKDINQWYANNCLLRFEYPPSEGDTNTTQMHDLLMTLCSDRKLPDIEFFLNRRDFPMIRRSSTEPYNHIFGPNTPLVSHNYAKYVPIFSMVTGDDYADIPFPTGDDWDRVNPSKFFPPSCRVYPTVKEFGVRWDQKKPTAVWRGASTGCGVTVETNVRLRLASMGVSEENLTSSPLLLDVGLTKWNLRARKLQGERYLRTIDIQSTGLTLVPRLTPQEQSTYKYIVHVDGHVAAFRLSLEMGMGCCILLADSPYRLWFSSMMEPMVHYVPVKADLSDLYDRIRWCRSNDKKCKKIAENARGFFLKYLQSEGQLDYVQKTLTDLKSQMGVYLYNHTSPKNRQLTIEKSYITRHLTQFPKPMPDLPVVYTMPSQSRSFGTLKGYEYLLNWAYTQSGSSHPEGVKSHGVIFSSKTASVEKLSYAGRSYMFKTTDDIQKRNESIHEVFIGLAEINDLSRLTPNFVYVYGYREGVLVEGVNGETMDHWIRSPKFNWADYILILTQLCLSLEVARRKCGFVHWDLTPWNIVLQFIPSPVEFTYLISDTQKYTVKTSVIPVIIDYGKSHVIHKCQHYGMVNMYATPTIQDVLGILLTSLNSIISARKNRNASEIVHLANFMTGTSYRKRKFRKTGQYGVSDVLYFVSKAQSYTELTNSDKGELTELGPLDFMKYLTDKYKIPVKALSATSTVALRLNTGNPRQVFNYIFVNSVPDRMMTFLSVFERASKCNLYKGSSMMYAYYVAQSIETNMTSVMNDAVRYLTAAKAEAEIRLITAGYEKVISHIKKSVSRDLVLDASTASSETSPVADYTEDIFLDPHDVLLRLKSSQAVEDLSNYRNVLTMVLSYQGQFELSPDTKAHYRKEFSGLLETVGIPCANRETLAVTSRALYEENIRIIGSCVPKSYAEVISAE